MVVSITQELARLGRSNKIFAGDLLQQCNIVWLHGCNVTKIIFRGLPCRARAVRSIFSPEKDATAIANPAMRQNKVRRYRLLTPFYSPAQTHPAMPPPGFPFRFTQGKRIQRPVSTHLPYP